MKLYWGPHTCAIGIHILLEELGAAYETEKIDVAGGATHEPWFLAINPKGKVPTLIRDDGSVLTEFGAIGTWLVRTNPDADMAPRDPAEEARVNEVTAYVTGTLHGQGFSRMMKPRKFDAQDVVHQATGLGTGSVKAQGRKMVEDGFAILDPQLGQHEFAAGDRLSVADMALFYVERWAPSQDITLPANVQRHFQMMDARPAVRKVRAIWGEA